MNKSIITLLFSFLTLSSCLDGFLEIDPETILTEENFWLTEDDARAGVNSIYEPLQSAYKSNYIYWFLARSDNWYSSVGTTDASSVQNVCMNDISTSMKPCDWNDFYYAITRANYAIHFLPNVPNIPEATRKHLMAESYFLRAKCYFDIARIWGKAPLITKPTLSLQDVDYPTRNDQSELLQQVKNDISESLRLANRSATNKHFFTYPAGLTLAAHYYMWMHDYNKVDSLTQELIDSKQFSLVNSADWGKMLNEGNTSENIWTMPWSYANNGTNSFIVYLCQSQAALYISEPLRLKWQSAADVKPDARFEQTTNITVRAPYAYNHLQTRVNGSGIWKFSLKEYVPKTGVEIPIILFRYAEVLLLRAEALTKLNRIEEAVALLNQVHGRSVPNDVIPKERFTETADPQAALENAILDERQIELLGEGYRWFDLVRTDKYKAVMNDFFENYIGAKSNIKYNLYEEDDDQFFPVYNLNLIDNPNLND